MDNKTTSRQLEHIQRLTCLHVTGALRTTPSLVLKIIVGLTPLSISLKHEAMLACFSEDPSYL